MNEVEDNRYRRTIMIMLFIIGYIYIYMFLPINFANQTSLQTNDDNIIGYRGFVVLLLLLGYEIDRCTYEYWY